jgi:hypothetical protein
VEIGTPTATPTATATPTPALSAAEISISKVSSRNIYYRGRGCGPQFVTITAMVKWSSAINYVGLYYRLQDQASGAYSDWQNKTMFLASAGPPPLYRATIDVASEIAGYSHFPKSWFQYQIVAKDIGGAQIHSEVFWDIDLSLCTK